MLQSRRQNETPRLLTCRWTAIDDEEEAAGGGVPANALSAAASEDDIFSDDSPPPVAPASAASPARGIPGAGNPCSGALCVYGAAWIRMRAADTSRNN